MGFARTIFALVVLFSAAAAASEGQGYRRRALELQRRLIAVIERVKPAVVAVFRRRAFGAGTGSGVIIDPKGYALTNYHVVGQALEVRCGLPDGRIYPARVVGRDPTGDIALLRLRGRSSFPFVTLGDSDRLRPGQWVIAMGNPFNLSTDFQPTVTLGIVSGLNRYLRGRGDNTLIYTDAIQIDAPINPGNSGGPLFNSAGELVGINGRIAGRPTRGRVNVGAGFAISINQIKRFLPMLRAGHDVYHARLGVRVAEREEGAPGLRVVEVLPDSAAQLAGIQPGDIILRFNGQAVHSRHHLLNMIGVLPAGTGARLTIERAGKVRELAVELGGLPAGWGVAAGPGRGKPIVPAGPVQPVADPALTAEAVLARHLAARGGARAAANLPPTRSVAKLTLFGPRTVSARVTLFFKPPDKYRLELVAETRLGRRKRTVREVRGFDGRTGWVKRQNAPTLAMPGSEVEELHRDILARRILLEGLREPQLTLRLLGQTTIGEHRVYVVLAESPRLGQRWWYFDRSSYLLLRTRYRLPVNGLWFAEDLSDYRTVAGFKMPFRTRQYRGGRMVAEVVVESVKVEKGLKDSFFAAPK